MTFNPKDHLMDMRGKDYLEVKWRLVWFRDEHPTGKITTAVLSFDPPVVQATITDADGNLLSTGIGAPKLMGVAKDRPFEGAETAAIGRALAHAGYGTQFTGEDEGDNLADSPVARKPAKPATNGTQNGATKTPPAWKADAIKWMVDEKYADNGPNAAAMWELLNLDTAGSKAKAAKTVKLYREWRDTTDAKPEVAAEHAKAGNTPS